MELLVATLCDTAVENQGKLNVLGAFDAIVAQSFPARFACNLALRFSFTSADHGSHKFSILLVDDSEAPTENTQEESDMQVNMPEGTAGFSTQNLITPLQGTVAKAGTYHFDIRFDGKVLVRVPLRVISQSDIAQPA
ncbi:MAG: hypothetical protein RI957_663 [Verrucomicrobiota bacterium]|jgi:hypothetical protein